MHLIAIKILCTLTLTKNDCSQIQSYTFTDLIIPSCSLLNLNQASPLNAISIYQLLPLLTSAAIIQQAIYPNSIPANIYHALMGELPEVTIATTRIPDYGNFMQHPSFGYRCLGSLAHLSQQSAASRMQIYDIYSDILSFYYDQNLATCQLYANTILHPSKINPQHAFLLIFHLSNNSFSNNASLFLTPPTFPLLFSNITISDICSMLQISDSLLEAARFKPLRWNLFSLYANFISMTQIIQSFGFALPTAQDNYLFQPNPLVNIFEICTISLD